MKFAISIFLILSIIGIGIGKFTKEIDGNGIDLHPLSDEMIRYINRLKPLWKAGRNFHQNTSLEKISRLMGSYFEPWYLILPQRPHYLLQGLQIPDEFDARVKWPNCPSLKEIRDQGSCGSCWAFGAAASMTDRYCIATKGTKLFNFSAENIISCCGILNLCGFGCKGGFPAMAWRYYKRKGIVSGGPFGSTTGCQPYEVPPCEHHINGSRPDCSDKLSPTPACHKTCQSSYDVEYNDDLKFASDVYSLSHNVDQIQIEIMKHGPVEATFNVYEDFLSYKSGVYHHIHGGFLGGHAVKILGWGTENQIPYWLVANSWNYDWGDGGFFKILRGHNECRIESSLSSGIPDLNERSLE